MKNYFKGFYNPSINDLEAAWKSESTIFVFDTNVFLNLYGYGENTRNDFFGLIEMIKDNLWIPYHVGLEYQRRRLEIIKDEKAIFNRIYSFLEKIEKIFKDDFEELALKRRFPKLYDKTDKLGKDIQKLINNYKKSASYWDEKQPCVRSHDIIRERLTELTNGRVGEKPINQEWLDKLYKEGEKRYENKVPPGFKDAVKAKASDSHFVYEGLTYDRQYGDLILWKQLIKKASEDNVKNVIFVTDDSKEDWWYILDSRGKKQIGPLAGLQAEIYTESNINLFYMYNTSTFLEKGKGIFDIDVQDSSIHEANSVFKNSLNVINGNINLSTGEFIAQQLDNYIRHKNLIKFIDAYKKSSNNLDSNLLSKYSVYYELFNKLNMVDIEKMSKQEQRMLLDIVHEFEYDNENKDKKNEDNDL